ncbi:MAG: type II toxin-antitoxin system HicB family antitoxin [Gemmatimonas sp.]
MTDYIALIRTDGSRYTARFPDFPTVSADGDTMDETRDAARKALASHIAFMVDDGQRLPAPASLARVMEDRRNRDAVAVLVATPTVGRKVRVAVSLDEQLVQEIDALAAREGLGRTGFLAEALRQYIATVRQADKIHAEVKAMKRAQQRASKKRV